MASYSPLTGIAAGFYTLFGLSVVVMHSFTDWNTSHLGAYLRVGFGADLCGAVEGWILAHQKS
jgi:hypothetical protein